MRILKALILLFFPLTGFSQEHDCYQKELIQNESQHFWMSKYSRGNNDFYGYDLTHLELKWNIDPTQNYISGSVSSTFKVIEADFWQITFDFSDSLLIDSIVYKGILLNYQQEGSQLIIALSDTLGTNDQASISVYYQGNPKPEMTRSFVMDEHNGSPMI